MTQDTRLQSVAAPEPRPWRRGLAWLAFLGPFFFASYGFANWVASQHPGVRVVVFDWERHIPFLPWTILPYWLIDLFYGISLLLFATRHEVDTHARRLLAAQLVAIGCFLAFPLRFSFERPAADGVAGWLFTALAAFDLPYNQAPSLHIALLVILWVAYVRILPRVWHWVLHATAVLIGVSVMTTWQHHFIDLPTGWWLGWFCVWLFPHAGRSPLASLRLTADPARRRLALRYACAGIALAGAAFAGGGAWLWLLWAAASLVLVAVNYGWAGEAGFQKRADGTMTPAAWWLLWPYFLGARLNSRWWTRRLPRMDAILPGLCLGRIPAREDTRRAGIAGVVDLAAELPASARVGSYHAVPMLDLVVPDGARIDEACRAIEAALRAGPVLVCCALGYTRSALAVAAWLLRSGAAGTVDEAVSRVRSARPAVVLGPEHLAALAQWQQGRADRAAGAGRLP